MFDIPVKTCVDRITKKELDEFLRRKKMKMSDFIRQAITEKLKSHKFRQSRKVDLQPLFIQVNRPLLDYVNKKVVNENQEAQKKKNFSQALRVLFFLLSKLEYGSNKIYVPLSMEDLTIRQWIAEETGMNIQAVRRSIRTLTEKDEEKIAILSEIRGSQGVEFHEEFVNVGLRRS